MFLLGDFSSIAAMLPIKNALSLSQRPSSKNVSRCIRYSEGGRLPEVNEMPLRHSVVHEIGKKPDGSPAALFLGASEQVESQARDDLMSQLNESYNATAGKDWGFFHGESSAYLFRG
jgi:hypothetical protein